MTTANIDPGRTSLASPSSRDSALFWEPVQQRSLVAVRCGACGSLSHPPKRRCAVCGEREATPVPVEGKGTLYASTVVERQTDPKWPVPFTVVLVDVDDAPGLRLAGSLQGRWNLRPGQPMEVWFERRPDGTVVPQWRPVPNTPDAESPATPPP